MSEDLIKRSDAIEQLNEAISICPPCMKGTGIYRTSALEEAIDIINQLPSADRPQGEWEDYDRYMKCCSKCGWIQDILHFGSNFCPNCGARMRPKLQGTHFDSIIIDECAMKGADDETN